MIFHSDPSGPAHEDDDESIHMCDLCPANVEQARRSSP